MTYENLRAWLNSYPDQVEGLPCATCETGEHYEEFASFAIARPDDVDLVTKVAKVDVLMSSVAGRALHVKLPPLTARVLSDILSKAYRQLGLRHMDKELAA